MNIKKILFKTFVFVGFFIFLMTSSLFAEETHDKETWATNIMIEWQKLGILEKEDSSPLLRMNDMLTKVEAITILNRINNIDIEVKKDDYKYKDVESFRWYYDEVEKAVATGLINGNPSGEIKPKAVITREEAFVMIAKLFKITYTGSKNPKEYIKSVFTDGDMAGNWSSPYLAGLSELGYINGFEDNTLRPKDYITRAEFIKILDNMIEKIISEPGEYDLSNVMGTVVVNVNGVTLFNVPENATIYLTSGSNEEVEIQIEDDYIPRNISIGTVASNVDYKKFAPSRDEIVKGKVEELISNFKLPSVERLTSNFSKTYYSRVKGTDKWNDLIQKVATEEDIDPVFIKCIMSLESGGKEGIKSKKNTNGTYDYGLMQVNSGWGTSFNYDRMLTDNEYAIRSGIIVIKRKIEAAERNGKNATVHEVAWRYNGYSSKGLLYADKLSKLYEELSGNSRYSKVKISEFVMDVR